VATLAKEAPGPGAALPRQAAGLAEDDELIDDWVDLIAQLPAAEQQGQARAGNRRSRPLRWSRAGSPLIIKKAGRNRTCGKLEKGRIGRAMLGFATETI